MRRALVVLALALVLAVTARPVPSRAQQPSLRIESLVVHPVSIAAGDVANVVVTVVDATEKPRSGMRVEVTVQPASRAVGESAPPLAEIRQATELAPGQYTLEIPLNEPGTWRIVVRASDGIESAQTDTEVFVAPRFAVPPAAGDPVLLRGSSWVTIVRFDAETGSVVRFLGESVVRIGERAYIVRRSLEPAGPISRLYGGPWRVSLVLTDVRTGEERRVELPAVRASLQPGSATTPAMTLAIAGFPDRAALAVYQATRLGEGWHAELFIVELETGTLRTRLSLPGALRGTQLVPRVAVATSGEVIVLERAISLDGSGEARLSAFAAEGLAPETVRRWPFVPTASGGTDCLANPEIDGGLVGEGAPQWFAWCRDGTGTWLGLWDLPTGRLVGRFPADPTTTAVLPAPDGRVLYLVDLAQRRVAAVDLADATLREPTTVLPSPEEDRPWWRRVVESLVPAARAAEDTSLRVALSSDGRRLFVVYPLTDEQGDGVWVYDAATLEPIEHLLPGWLLRGVLVTAGGTLVAVASDEGGDRFVVLERGEPRLLVSLPERVSEALR
ncbi:MAG: FixH family protein [Thermomicrobium sp.]|nr:FixH family protein [Thermomicrobium sp.]